MSKITKEQADKTAHHIYISERQKGKNVSYETVKKETIQRLKKAEQKGAK
jgi:hypothetical protein